MLLAQEAVQIVGVKVGGQHFDRDRAVQQRLSASIHNANAAASDFDDVVESGFAQFRGNAGTSSRCVACESTSAIDGSLSSAGGRLTSVTNDTICRPLPTEDAIDPPAMAHRA